MAAVGPECPFFPALSRLTAILEKCGTASMDSLLGLASTIAHGGADVITQIVANHRTREIVGVLCVCMLRIRCTHIRGHCHYIGGHCTHGPGVSWLGFVDRMMAWNL
jgi:hypothetical protein